jgi:hypothetical protein
MANVAGDMKTQFRHMSDKNRFGWKRVLAAIIWDGSVMRWVRVDDPSEPQPDNRLPIGLAVLHSHLSRGGLQPICDISRAQLR